MSQRVLVRGGIAASIFLGLAFSASAAHAEPQASVGLTVGAAGVGYNRQIWDTTAFHLGVRGDVLFGRSGTKDFGIGPYAEVLTHAFNEIQFGGGVSGLIPVLDPFPLVLSVGAYGRKGDDAYSLEPGLSGALFFGSRSYNFHANYVMSVGLLAQMRYGLGPSKETSIVVGAQLDAMALALPFVFLFNAIRGPSSEAAPVR